MPRALMLCLSIVAAFPLSMAAEEPLSADVPVSGALVQAARMLGLEPAAGRARFMSELVRLLYSLPEDRNPAVQVLRRRAAPRTEGAAEPVSLVPVPLTAPIWSAAVFGRSVAPADLASAIAADRRAALVCYALASLDDDTLAYLGSHHAILRTLYERDAAAFAAFGAALRIEAGRVVPPGGEIAVPLWEAVVGRSVDEPAAFIDMLFSLHGANVAYLYELVHFLDEPRARFVLGTWLPDPSERLARFVALAQQLAAGYDSWDLQNLPFSRPLNDFTFAVLRWAVDPSGRPEPPAERSFWSLALQVPTLEPENDRPVDALWLAQATGAGDLAWRGDRLDQLGFGQRVFAGVSRAAWPDAATAIGALPRQRMLMLTLERMGIRTPAAYAAASARAEALAAVRAGQTFWALAQFQGALAALARMAAVGTLDTAGAEALVRSLAGVNHDDQGRYGTALVEWIERALVPALPPGDDVEERLLAALSGPLPEATAPRFWWEGQEYVIDLASAERKRLSAVRAKQGGATVDLVVALRRIVDRLSSGRDPDRIGQASAALRGLVEEFGPHLSASGSEVTPRGAPPHRQVRERVDRLADDLERAAAAENLRRAGQLLEPLGELMEAMLGEALLSWAYAVDIGEPDGTALLTRNVALRHDFGLGRTRADARVRMAWTTPYQDFLPGVPWHVSGSALGLDLALASLALRRTDLNRLTLTPPRLPSNEREAFPINVSVMDPRRLKDEDRDLIARAVERGRRRVTALADGSESLALVADAIRMDGWRRRAIRWMLEHDREAIPTLFALVELVELGGGALQADLDAWGPAVHNSYGCVCTRLLGAGVWPLLRGRPRLGLMAASVSDLNLQVAVTLAGLRVPAVLARHVMGAALLDYIGSVAPTDPNDWWTLVRSAQTVTRERVEDYIATAAAIDGPLVPYVAEGDRVP